MIREYRDTDNEAILSIYREAFPQYSLNAITDRLSDCKTWVNVKGGKGTGYGRVTGYCILGGNYIEQVAVHADHRGHGIGSKLIRYAEKRCSLNSPTIALHVRADNRAFLLYERLGYKVREFVRNLYGYGFDGYAMEKSF